jgi:hypothetical protein
MCEPKCAQPHDNSFFIKLLMRRVVAGAVLLVAAMAVSFCWSSATTSYLLAAYSVLAAAMLAWLIAHGSPRVAAACTLLSAVAAYPLWTLRNSHLCQWNIAAFSFASTTFATGCFVARAWWRTLPTEQGQEQPLL